MQGGNGMGHYAGPSMVVGSPSEAADSAFVANASVWTIEFLTAAKHQHLCCSIYLLRSSTKCSSHNMAIYVHAKMSSGRAFFSQQCQAC